MVRQEDSVLEPFETDNPYKEGMWRLTLLYVKDFIKDPDATLKMIAGSPVYIGVLMTTYHIAVTDKELPALEEISASEKTKLWNTAQALIGIETFPPSENRGELVQKRRMNFCKCLWLLNSVLEKMQ